MASLPHSAEIGPAGDLGPAQAVDVDEVATRAQEWPEAEFVRHADAVDEGEYAVAVHAADVEAGQAEPAARAADRHAGLEAHEVGDVAGEFAFDPRRVDDRYGRRNVGGVSRRPGAYDSDGLQPIIGLVACFIVVRVVGGDRQCPGCDGRSGE